METDASCTIVLTAKTRKSVNVPEHGIPADAPNPAGRPGRTPLK